MQSLEVKNLNMNNLLFKKKRSVYIKKIIFLSHTLVCLNWIAPAVIVIVILSVGFVLTRQFLRRTNKEKWSKINRGKKANEFFGVLI